MNYLKSTRVELAPRLPSGANLSPLEIYVNPALKRRPQGKDMSSREKVADATARSLGEMSSDPEFGAGLKKCFRSIKKRAQWVAAHGERISTSSLVKAWAGPDEGA